MGVEPDQGKSAEPASSDGPRSAPRTRQGGGPQGRRPEDDLLGFKARLFMGVLFATLYIVTFGSRGDSWLPHIVSGLLGGAVVFLILKEVDERRKRRLRRNPPPPVRRKHRD